MAAAVAAAAASVATDAPAAGKRREVGQTDTVDASARAALGDAQSIINLLRAMLMNRALCAQAISYELCIRGLCSGCNRVLESCTCTSAEVVWVKRILARFSADTIEPAAKRHGIRAALMRLTEVELALAKPDPGHTSSKELTAELVVCMSDVTAQQAMQGRGTFEIVREFGGPKRDGSVTTTRWLFEMLRDRAGLTLNTVHTTSDVRVLGVGERAPPRGLNVTRTVLRRILNDHNWSAAEAFVGSMPGFLCDTTQAGMLTIACEFGAPFELIKLLVERSTDYGLNYSTPDRPSPLKVVIDNDLRQRTRRSFYRSDYDDRSGYNSVLLLLLAAARDDGSGVDLQEHLPTSLLEYARLRIQAHRSNEFLDRINYHEVTTEKLLAPILNATRRVGAYHGRLVSVLQTAFRDTMASFPGELVMLVGEYIAPRFEELRRTATMALSPVQPRPPAAAAAGAVDADAAVAAPSTTVPCSDT